MVLHIDALAGGALRDFLVRIDRARGASRDGRIDRSEATLAARRIARQPNWREAADAAFGVAPESGAELLRFAARPPREEALARILGSDVAGRAEMQSDGRGSALALGEVDGRRLVVTAAGRLKVGDKLPSDLRTLADTHLTVAAWVVQHGLPELSPALARRLFAQLSDALTVAQSGRGRGDRERLFAASTTLLIKLADEAGARLGGAITDRLLQAVAGQRDVELKIFYLGALERLAGRFDPAQRAALNMIRETTLPQAPPVEAYTRGRSQPLEVRQVIHPEFWREELRFYSAKDGWRETHRDAKDTVREFERVIADPKGKRPPLVVHVKVRQDELDVLADMDDPKVHVIIYSGHSAIGGNGSQSIDEAPRMRGLPKTVLIANCRGKDNYAEFANKFQGAMLIGTRGPTYSEAGIARIKALYETLAAGDDFAAMRRRSAIRVDDEPADNYIYPDELLRFFPALDADEDGKSDGRDLLFDFERRRRGLAFTRALNFANSIFFYHWEVDHENGQRSVYGREYGDHLIADGPLTDAKPGEVVRVTPEERRGESGQRETFFRVQYDPALLRLSRDVYAGVVTAHVAMALAKHKFGRLTPQEVMRGLLFGAQAVWYLDVYTNTSPQSFQDYFRFMGVPADERMWREMEKLMETYDAHANNPQTAAFTKMLAEKYGVDAKTFTPSAGNLAIA